MLGTERWKQQKGAVCPSHQIDAAMWLEAFLMTAALVENLTNIESFSPINLNVSRSGFSHSNFCQGLFTPLALCLIGFV